MILVFDSSVWVSAFHFSGIPLTALKCAHNHHRIAICEPIFNEVHATLTGKFGWPSIQVHAAFDEFGSRILEVTALGRLHGICRDPNDDMILECAVAARADIIVTGDKDLLAVGEYEGIRVMTPRAFVDEFAAPVLP